MILKSFQICDFQSVTDSNPAKVGDITCLVGKNEAGKTALLKALYRLRPITKGDDKFDVTDDYPRSRVTEYEQEVKAGKRGQAIVVTATFTLEKEELGAVEEYFGKSVLPESAVTLSRGYENKSHFDLKIDEKIAGETLLAKAKLAGEFKAENIKWDSLKALAAALQQRGQAQQKKFEDANVAANALADTDEKKKAVAEAQSLQETSAAKSLRTELDAINGTGIHKHIYDKFLEAYVPEFLYFDEYYQMRGCENIEALQKRIAAKQLNPSDHPLLGLIELAGLKLEELLNPARTQELKNKLQGAGNHLTGKILKYWSQNRHLRLAFDVRPARPGDPEGMRDGTNIWAEVADQKHFVNTALGTRSRGFVWFFSFLAWYSRLKATMQQRIILLLDEPGLSLHARAQEDLLRYFEQELKGDHQVLYSTHSPFMVDVKHFERVRIVQDKTIDSDAALPPEEEGTKVLVDVLEAGEDSLFPLQGALGYEIYQGLFIGPNSLVVEGASDLLFIQALSSIMAEKGRTGLNPTWTITPVGGADKVPTFVALIGAQKALRVATLIDLQTSGVQMVENLYKRKLLARNHVLTFAQFTGKTEADIEDMFEADFYVELVNEEYKNQLSQAITAADLNLHHPRILVSIEEYLKENPLKTGGFNHYRPARYFMENTGRLAKNLSAATLYRFEEAFKALNALLT
ncbi:MAG: AAA family ATPase [Candidatus Acidiferrales bacterium]